MARLDAPMADLTDVRLDAKSGTKADIGELPLRAKTGLMRRTDVEQA